VHVGEHVPNPVRAATPDARERRVAAWVPHFSAVAPLLVETDLIATLPMIAMADAMDRYDLVALRPPVPLDPMAHCLIASRHLGEEPGSRWFRDCVREAFRISLDASESRVLRRMRA
jgi:DNA-binding transcriptional LysR family regulator